MGIEGVHHVVLLVTDVPEAEAFYRDLFDMDISFREGVLGESVGTVPEEFDWDTARAKGVSPTMSFLTRDNFALAVAQAESGRSGRMVDHIALRVTKTTLEGVTKRAEACGCTVERNAAHHRTVEDTQGFEWELNTSSPPASQAFDLLEL